MEQSLSDMRLAVFSRVVEQTADYVIITDRRGNIEYVNPAFERLTGYTLAEAMGKTPRILKSEQHDQEFYANLWRIILAGKVFREVTCNKKKTARPSMARSRSGRSKTSPVR